MQNMADRIVSGVSAVSSSSSYHSCCSPARVLDCRSHMLSVLRSTFDLRVSFQELEGERIVVVQRIAAVSAQIRTTHARFECLRGDGAMFAEQVLEERQEHLNRLIIQTQQASNTTAIVRSRQVRTDDVTGSRTPESCVARLQSLLTELEGRKHSVDVLMQKVEDAASRRLAGNDSEETDAWRELSAVLDATHRLISIVIHFVSHAIEVCPCL